MVTTQIILDIIMVGVAVAIIVWLKSSAAAASGASAASAASSRRMMGMMKRFGLDPGTFTRGDPQTMAIGKDLRRRCMRCRRGDHCERWLAGEVDGRNNFCPNAEEFRILAWSAMGSAPTLTVLRT